MKLIYSILCLALVVLSSCDDGSTDDTLTIVECAATEQLCDGECRAIETDSNSCGACNSICADGWFCRAGECIAPPLSSCPDILDDSVIGTTCNNEGLSCGGCGPCVNCYLVNCLNGEWVGGEIFGSPETCRSVDGDDHFCNAEDECTNECFPGETDPCPEDHECLGNVCVEQSP